MWGLMDVRLRCQRGCLDEGQPEMKFRRHGRARHRRDENERRALEGHGRRDGDVGNGRRRGKDESRRPVCCLGCLCLWWWRW